MASSHEERVDVYTRVTDQIVSAIEAGAGDWKMPWHSGDHDFAYPTNAVTGKAYRGINVLALWAEAYMHGYVHAQWATFKQWSDSGCHVRKGERAAIGVFWKPINPYAAEEEPSREDGEDTTQRWIARAFPLFNAAQVDGFRAPERPDLPPQPRIARADAFYAAIDADVHHGGGRAFYDPKRDLIQLPPFEAFSDPIAYYTTRSHETIHWSGAERRMARDLSGRFGTDAYAAEELIAELGAAFLAASLDLTVEPRADHAAYIESWLKILKGDKRAIFSAAGHAQRATDFLYTFQSEPAPVALPRTTQVTRLQGPAP